MDFGIVVLVALLSVGSLFLCGCDPEQQTKQLEAPSYMQQDDQRVTVTRIQVIEDELAYHGRRGVYLIVDKETGQRFLGISGVGISELGSHSSGKSTVSDER